jgi:lipopolysaccharide/colanic/teichoic acid biosynthesis glycosyltransferase
LSSVAVNARTIPPKLKNRKALARSVKKSRKGAAGSPFISVEVQDRGGGVQSASYRAIKRFTDLILGSVLLLTVLPVIVASAIALAVLYRRSPLFVQVRVGRNGQPFKIWKLRTLPPGTPAYTDKYALQQLHVPRLALAIRRAKVDELPQLVQVITGKMSLVGPRPEMRFLDEAFEPGFAALRRTVRPGCTGLWQISDRCDQLIHEAPQYDLTYLERASFGMDLWIFAKTISLVARGRTVSLADIPERGALRQRRRIILLPDPAKELARRASHSGLDLLVSAD